MRRAGLHAPGILSPSMTQDVIVTPVPSCRPVCTPWSNRASACQPSHSALTQTTIGIACIVCTRHVCKCCDSAWCISGCRFVAGASAPGMNANIWLGRFVLGNTLKWIYCAMTGGDGIPSAGWQSGTSACASLSAAVDIALQKACSLRSAVQYSMVLCRGRSTV